MEIEEIPGKYREAGTIHRYQRPDQEDSDRPEKEAYAADWKKGR